MKVINSLDFNKATTSSTSDKLTYLKNFRAISALEGNSTSKEHSQMLNDLAMGKISKQDYIKARMKTA